MIVSFVCLLVLGAAQAFPQQAAAGRFALRRPRIQKIRLGPLSSVTGDSLEDTSASLVPTVKKERDLEAAASQISSTSTIVDNYPSQQIFSSEPASDSYLGPASFSPSVSPSEVSNDIFSLPAADPATSLYQSPGSSEFFSSPSEAVEEVFELPALETYGEPLEETVFAPSEAVVTSFSPATSTKVVTNTYSNSNQYSDSFSQPSVTRNQISSRPVTKIVRSEFSGPNDGNWNYAYETENGIKQEARGELKTVGDSLVSVMSGSYSYIGADGLTYVVDWYADETGFHPSAPHLPKNVPIPFPEVQAAVDQQLRFAEEEAAAASQISSVSLGGYESQVTPLSTNYGVAASDPIFTETFEDDTFLQSYGRGGRQTQDAHLDSQQSVEAEDQEDLLEELESEVFDDFKDFIKYR